MTTAQHPDPDESGHDRPDPQRDETATERLDRLWGDLLQELRVMQTGAQLTSGFLLTLPFQNRFQDLSTTDRRLYLALVLISLLITGIVMTAVAVHQRLSGRHLKELVVAVGRWVIRTVLALLAVLIVGITAFVFDFVVGSTAATIAGIGFGALLALLLIVVPRVIVAPAKRSGKEA